MKMSVHILFLNVIFYFSLVAMDDTAKAEREKEAERIAQEIAALKKPRDVEKAAHFLQWKPQPVLMASEGMYSEIAKLCTYEYVPLMRKLLEKGIVKADAYCSNCAQYPFTLLTEAIHNALVDDHKDLEMVELLLQKGASVKREGLCFKDWVSDPVVLKKRYVTPLMRAAFNGNVPLTTLLLEYRADPNMLWQGNTPFMHIVKEYIYRLFASENQPTPQTTQLNKYAWKRIQKQVDGTIGSGEAQIKLSSVKSNIRLLETKIS